MRLVFAGTPRFAERALARLLDAGHEVALVLAQPERAAGRGLRPTPGAVARLARARGLTLFQPETLKSAEAVARLRAARPDAMVVAAYGLILPPAVLALPPRGAINIHASLLPRWRGAAPIQRALLAGDRETGVSIMQMDAGLDTGPVLARRSIGIAADDDSGSLHDKLADLGAEEIVAVLARLERGEAAPVPQGEEGATYAPKIDKQETWLDWHRPAVELERAVRAFKPSPGAATRLAGQPLKVWRARVAAASGAPGTLLDPGPPLLIACGEGALAVEEVQRSGGRRMPAAQFLRGHRLEPGMRLE
ncbi:MAG: methionyl-tRNA formyltransferase [Betaproteobacteria bacterium]